MVYKTVSFSWQLLRKGGERERRSVWKVRFKKGESACRKYISSHEPWCLFTRGMCPIGHFVSYSPTAVFWSFSEHCPHWHWSVWKGIVELSGLWTNHPKIHPTQNYWVFGLCPLPSILETRKNSILETGSVSILRWGKTPTLLSPLEGANLNHWTRRWTKSKNAVILSIIHHHHNPLESTYSSHCYTYWNDFQMQWRSVMRLYSGCATYHAGRTVVFKSRWDCRLALFIQLIS
jgi:hypothetical protein